jgi:Rps23 Pro-64 3,4-dihydroxylase Tpa1-like proline 4-hydroxylase
MDYKELATGIVVVNDIGKGKKYLEEIESYVDKKILSWVPHDQKKIDEDLNRKAMNTMYIKNIRRWGFGKTPTPSQIIHDYFFDRFERDFHEAYEKYTQDFHVPYSQKEDYEILKYGPGNFFIDHIDDGLFMTRRVSVVYYFNDDYKGGEIIFPRFDLEIKPKANQLLLFPANYIYNHNVNEVTEGTRYSMVNWLK